MGPSTAIDVASLAVAPRHQASSSSPLALNWRSFAVGLAGIVAGFIYGKLPPWFYIIIPLYLGLSIVSISKPRFPLYYIFLILTTIKFFQLPDFTIYRTAIGQSFRFVDPTHPVIQFADELALLLCLQQLALRTSFFRIMPQFLRELRIGRYFKIFLIVLLFSFVVNLVRFDNLLYFLTNWLRPFIIMAYIFVLPWTERQVKQFVGFLIVLAFVFQLGGSLMVNWPSALAGDFFWIDDFTGTFMFPLCEWASFLLAIALFMFLGEYSAAKQPRYLLWAGFAFFGIVSAQVGTMTSMLLIMLGMYFGMVFFNPKQFGLSAFKGRAAMLVAILTVVVFATILWNYEDPTGKKLYAVQYAQDQFKKRVLEVVSVRDVPKVLAYYNLFNAMGNGEINPIWGAGPAMYLTGTGQALNNSPLVDKYSATAIFGGEMTGQAESQSVSIVGLTGELGILGVVAYLALLFALYRRLWSRRHLLFHTPWHGALIGVMGAFTFLMGYAVIQGPFDGWIEMPYNLALCSSLLLVARMKERTARYVPFPRREAHA